MGPNMEFLCRNLTESLAEVEAGKKYVASCEEELKQARAALRSAERELRAWQKEPVATALAASADR